MGYGVLEKTSEQKVTDSAEREREMLWFLILENGIRILEWKSSH